MSNAILIDESNGNGIFSVRSSNSINITSDSSAVTNFPVPIALTTAFSSEDLSQSLSEYTDADESMSAPTEFLAEFLSAVMLKDYKAASKYCQLILKYEPNNATAKEFYPLIQEKLNVDDSGESDDNEVKLNDDMKLDEDEIEIDDDEYEDGGGEDDETSSRSSSESEDVSSEDSEANCNQKKLNSLSGDGAGIGSNSDNTTYSYSSLLLEEDEDEVPNNLHLKDLASNNLDASNGNLISASCSDSESPTEPLTQRLAAILRSKCHSEKNN